MNEHHPLRDLRDHLPHRDEPEVAAETTTGSGPQPIPGYDEFSVAELMVEFHRHTQSELDACEQHERAHLNRKAVLDKLHYMHTRQPWEGYDDMPEEEILAVLRNADDETIKHVRDYERKFGRRPRIHDAAMELHHERLATHPAEAPPAYQPGGGSHERI